MHQRHSVQPPVPSSVHVRDRFRRQRTRDTKPELELRRRLHAAGLRYRVDFPVLADRRRRVDIAFPRARVAVLVHGCFWHSCDLHGPKPKANAQWWETKLRRTVERDAETSIALAAEGWRVLVVWEHDNPGVAVSVIAATVSGRLKA